MIFDHILVGGKGASLVFIRGKFYAAEIASAKALRWEFVRCI